MQRVSSRAPSRLDRPRVIFLRLFLRPYGVGMGRTCVICATIEAKAVTRVCRLRGPGHNRRHDAHSTARPDRHPWPHGVDRSGPHCGLRHYEALGLSRPVLSRPEDPAMGSGRGSELALELPGSSEGGAPGAVGSRFDASTLLGRGRRCDFPANQVNGGNSR